MSEAITWRGYCTADIYDAQDTCLLAIKDGTPLSVKTLQRIPPDRAVLIAAVAEKAGISLEEGTHDQLKAEAKLAGSRGKLGDWWRK
jgi:hypothetical protein